MTDTPSPIGEGLALVRQVFGEVATDVVKLTFGNRLHEAQLENAVKLRTKTKERLASHGIEMDDARISPNVGVPLLEAAQNESREELQELWAKLLACAINPKTSHLYRRQFVGIIRAFEPIDALVIQELDRIRSVQTQENPRNYVATRLGFTQDQVQMSFESLRDLNCVAATADRPIAGGAVHLTVQGRELLRALNA